MYGSLLYVVHVGVNCKKKNFFFSVNVWWLSYVSEGVWCVPSCILCVYNRFLIDFETQFETDFIFQVRQ